VRDKLLEFLKALEAAIPPPQGHHAITFCRYGSDSDGWEAKLGLHIRMPKDFMKGDRTEGTKGESQTFFLDGDDLDQPTEKLVAEIVHQVQYLYLDPIL